MSDHVATAAPQRARGSRTALLVVLLVVAFVAGSLLMALASRYLPWVGGEGVTSATTTRQLTSSFTPAAPLNANGEAMIDTTTLASREATLAAQISALEARTAAVSAEAESAAGDATRAEALLTVVAARRAVDRGTPLGYLEVQLRDRFGGAQPRAVTTVVQAAREPVTLEDLRQGLDAIAPAITTNDDESWWDGMRREFSTLIVLRKAGTPSPLPADRLARARRLLDGGQVEAARAEVVRLPGAGDAANWIAAADRYASARRALDTLEAAALTAPNPPRTTG